MVLDHAYDRFNKTGNSRDRFDHFCLDNASWLDNYSFFVALKKRFDGRPWSEWPEELRDRVPEAMAAVQSECSADIEREKLGQYLFFEQWKEIKEYCNRRGIQIVGDIPIYVSYDSADVWGPSGDIQTRRRETARCGGRCASRLFQLQRPVVG